MAYIRQCSFVALLAFVGLVASHGWVTGVVADGIYYQGYTPLLQYQNPVPATVGWSIPQDLGQGPIFPVQYQNPDIICHVNATPAQKSATVSAGGKVNIQWTKWPTGHHGPVINYLARCNRGCATQDKYALKWNKFEADGLIDDTTPPGLWATDDLIANNNSQTVTIPKDLQEGEYVLRHEIIALHSAGSPNGAQNYPFCINLKVTGDGTNPLVETGTLGMELYNEHDPGILINIYQKLKEYIIPGPDETI